MVAKLTAVIQLHLVAENCYHLQFSLQAASPETFGYILYVTAIAGERTALSMAHT
jgi:hypothetical protein